MTKAKYFMDNLYFKLFIDFLVGGFVVTLVSYLGVFENPLIAALSWTYPLGLLPAIYFMKINGKSTQYISKFLFGIAITGILLLFTIYLMSYYIYDTNNITTTILKVSVIWTLIVGVLYYYLLNSKYKDLFI